MIYSIDTQDSATDILELIVEDMPEYTINDNILTINTGDYSGDSFEFSPDYTQTLSILEGRLPEPQNVLSKDVSEYDSDLIYGKDKTEGVVAIEVKDDLVHLFYEDKPVETRPMIYWMLAAGRLDKNFIRLKGNQHYCWRRQFSTKKAYGKFCGIYNSRDKYNVWNDAEMAMIDQGITLFKGMKVSDVSICSFDIEARGLVRDEDSEVFVITNTLKMHGATSVIQFVVEDYENDTEMILDWCRWVREIDPTILNGHNVFGYDLDYMRHCCNLDGEKMLLGRDGSAAKFGTKPKKYRVDGSQTWDYYNCSIFGRHIIDGMFLAVKYDIGRNYPSWGLKPIAEHEGLVSEDRVFYDASKIGKNWSDPVEREKIIAYCADDSNDSLALYELMIAPYFYLTQSLPKPFQTIINSATGSWFNSLLVRSYIQEGHSIPKANDRERVAGGMSYGVPGAYSNVSKWDAASYYPNTILTFDIYDREKDPKANFLEMVRFFTNKRFEFKRMYKETGDKFYDDIQASYKVGINSSYGLLGTGGLNFNSFENASLITRCCRKGLEKCILWATGKPTNYWWEEYEEEQDFEDYSHIDSKSEWSVDEMPQHDWILTNIDTDSLSFAKKDGSAFTKEDDELIHEEVNKIMYSDWEPDGRYSRFVVVKAKNYAMVEDGETKMKIKGSSFIDAKKEPAMIEMLRRLLQSYVDDDNSQLSIYNEYIKEAMNIKDINRWAVKKSITENLMLADSTVKQKTLDALKNKEYSIGDKVYLYNVIDGKKQAILKGEKVFLKKTGEPKMIDNNIVRCADDFDEDYDKWHYVKRVYKTFDIINTIHDMEGIINYSLKKNRKLLEE